MLDAAAKSAQIRDTLGDIISVEEVKIFRARASTISPPSA
jgi:hypothetical protein